MIKLLIFALSFLGLIAGVVLSFFTKEELKPGKKYFMLLEKVVLITISLIIVFYIGNHYSFFVLGFFAGIILKRVYFYFGVALSLASGPLLVLLSSLIFIFGLPRGTLLASNLNNNKIKKEIIISGILFLIAGLVSYFLSYAPLLMMCSGALIVSCASLKKIWIFPL